MSSGRSRLPALLIIFTFPLAALGLSEAGMLLGLFLGRNLRASCRAVGKNMKS